MNRIYKHVSVNMSQKQLSDLLYWCIMCDAIITATHTLGKIYTRKQNSRNTAWLVLGFKDMQGIERFEKETDFELNDPPNIVLNQE